jgi:hypothetical protein
MKQCSYCKEVKPLTSFNRDKNAPTGYSYSCKPCRSLQGKRYIKNNPEKVKSTWLRKYGLTLEEYKKIIDSQNSCCAICLLPLDMGLHTCVDHCHKTGKTREILCRKCNTILGQANDSTDILQSAILYLNKYKGT